MDVRREVPMRMRRRMSPLIGVTVLGLSALPRPAASQTAAGDPLAPNLLGTWVGEGLCEGNRLELTREWSLALGKSDSGDVSMHVLDELADSGPAWRRWVYRSTGEDS